MRISYQPRSDGWVINLTLYSSAPKFRQRLKIEVSSQVPAQIRHVESLDASPLDMATSQKRSTSLSSEFAVEFVDADGGGRPGRAPPIPAAVKINVEGAFIVEDLDERNGTGSEFVHYERKDIRLPHHTDVVSHIALDVSSHLSVLSVKQA